MHAKLLASNWTDPDDAPELTEEWFKTATYHVGDKTVTREEFKAAAAKRGRPLGSVKANPKQQATLRFDPEVLAAFRATGRGWQTRVNDVLRDWIKTHPAG